MQDEENQLKDVLPDSVEAPVLLFDDAPTSVYSMISEIKTLRDAVDRAVAENPELFEQDESFFKQRYTQNALLSRLRMNFWFEYERKVNMQQKMVLHHIIGGVCTTNVLQKRVLEDNEKLAYIFCPPTSYVVAVKEALSLGLENLRNIVTAKVVDDDGYLIPRAADVVLKAVALLDLRVKGAIIQKVDQRTLNVNLEAKDQRQVLPANSDELDKLIQETKQKLLTSVTPRPINEGQIAIEAQGLEIEPKRGTAEYYRKYGEN